MVAVARGTLRGTIMGSVGALCASIESLGDATGELVLTDSRGEMRGSIFLERGRICWAAARGLARRLTDLLGRRASVDRLTMEAHYRHCKEHRVPIGEHLVAAGVVTDAELADALRDHTLESVSALTTRDALGTFVPRSGAGYAPRFTFAPVEIYVAAHARVHANDGALAEPLVANGAHVLWAAAFLRGDTATPAAVAITGAHHVSMRALHATGNWAASSLDLAEAVSGGPALVAAYDSGRPPAFAFAVEGGMIAGIARDRAAVACIFADRRATP
jgi:hypothetical protein